jgi:hypothetical protein
MDPGTPWTEDGAMGNIHSPCADVERAFDDSFTIDSSKRYLLQNRTPKQICVTERAHGELRLSPLAQRVVLGARLAPFEPHLRELRQRHQLRVRAYADERRSVGLDIAVWCAVLTAVGVAVADVILYGTLIRLEALAASVLAVVLLLTVMVIAGRRETGRKRAEGVADAEEGDIAFGVGGAYYDGDETARRTKHGLTLATVVVVGAILPALAILVASDAKDYLVIEGGLRVVDGTESRLIARLIQMIYTAVLSLFPALMYFQFDRQRVGTIRGRWVRAIFRMDRRMQTLADVNARYGDELSEASSHSTDSTRFLGGRHSPIVVATILISLGWTLLVMPTESFDFAGATRAAVATDVASEAAALAKAAATGDPGIDLESRAATANDAARRAADASRDAADIAARSTGDTLPSTSTTELPSAGPAEDAIQADAASAAAAAEQAQAAEDALTPPFFHLLVPDPSAAGMAFLGAYFFGVYLVLGGYFRGDLRPKIYNQITARLVTVVVVAYLINALWSPSGTTNRPLWAVAFLAGVVPSTVLQRIGVLATSHLGDAADRGGDEAQQAPNEIGDGEVGDAGGDGVRGTGAEKKRKRLGRLLRRPFRWLRESFAATFATPRALTQIDGVDIYESTRLESEGVADVPSLARSDLVSMMVNTRLPIERLVDWTDQAMLVVLLDRAADATADNQVDKRVRALRRIGVRTATDLHEVAKAPGIDGTRHEVETILARDGGGDDRKRDGASLLQWLARRIDAEPQVRRIRYWRESEHANLRPVGPTIGPTITAGDRPCGADGNGNGDEKPPVSSRRTNGRRRQTPSGAGSR